MRKIDSKYINKDKLILKKNTSYYLFEVIFYLVVMGFWYSMIIIHPDIFKNATNILKCCILGFPVLLIPNIIRGIRIYMNGEIYYFDATLKEIRKNQKEIAVFSDIDFIQIRSIYGENDIEYRVSIVLKTGRKIRIEQSDNHKNMLNISEDMAGILQVVIKNK